MPGAGTHTTIIQHLAKQAQANQNTDFAKFLTNPDLNANWSTYGEAAALQSRYAVLGAMGPDIFYLMLDYGSGVQELEDVALKIAGTFRCVGKLSGEINNLITGALDSLTDGVWTAMQQTFANVKGVLVDGVLDLLIDKHNFWYFFLPLREVDDYRQNWYWADFLHYVKTGCFTQKLLDNARAQQEADPNSDAAKCLSAYALGYLTHYVADTIGHAYVNRIVESPWRNAWQRHHLVENFIDAHVWASWHDAGSQPTNPADEQNLDTTAAQVGDPNRAGAARLNFARLNDLCNIGSAGVDPLLDAAITDVCNLIQQGLFDIHATSVASLDVPGDPVFTTWTEYIADTMWQTYPPGQDHPTRMGRYPTPDDVAGAYGAYRLLLSLATEDHVDPPMPPDISGDLSSILNQMWNDITMALGSVPPPPSMGGSSFDLAAIWDATKKYVQWLGQVAGAALQSIGDLISGLIRTGATAAADTIKAGLYLVNSALYSIYHSLRMTLVMSAYSAPFTEDLNATWGPVDLRTLWNAGPTTSKYPVEPVLSERDFESNPANPFSPYRPYFKPSDLAPVNNEAPATSFPAELLQWMTPDDMLEAGAPGKDDMFTATGPAPATTSKLFNPDGTKLTDLETFDGSQRYFGTIFANCAHALEFAVPYLSGQSYPAGTVLPDYNLDSDRGFAWPCWDVDYAYQNPMNPFPWNGADPFPADTLARVSSSVIDWGNMAPAGPGLRPGLTANDPWGSPRHGNAWINAAELNATGDCGYADYSFPAVVVNPNRGDLLELDVCHENENKAEPPPLLSPDYQMTPDNFLQKDPHDTVKVYTHLPYLPPPTVAENDGRLADFLRALAAMGLPELTLANAVSLQLGGATSTLPAGTRIVTGPGPIPFSTAEEKADLVKAVAQLAVTGRRSFELFAKWAPQDADLVNMVNQIFPHASFNPTQLKKAAVEVLDMAYTALWAIRANEPGWRSFRHGLGWIAASGFDDTPHRPVNVPTAPYPQYDIELEVPIPNPMVGGSKTITTRYMVASANTFVGPDDTTKSGFGDPKPQLLAAPAGSFASIPAPRTIPDDAPQIPHGNKILLYVHGGGSRAEEAVDMANWFIIEGQAAGEEYTVVSLDLPNSGYATTFEITDVVGPNYDHNELYVLQFEQQFIMAFVDALEQKIGNVKSRIAAVMGGSLGGNMSALLTNWYDANHPYLHTIVAWSVTAMAPANYVGVLPGAELAAYLNGMQAAATSAEGFDDHITESQYIQVMYTKPLSNTPPLVMPPQPIMWFRGGYAPDGSLGFQPCKDESIARSRFDRYEIYSPFERHWTTAIDLEQITFSFQDFRPNLSVVSVPAVGQLPASSLMLVAGEQDNYNPNAIYNSTISVARALRMSGQGKAEFWLDTGHSIHSERPHLFCKEIIYFLTHPGAGDSPYGTVVSTPPRAPFSLLNS